MENLPDKEGGRESEAKETWIRPLCSSVLGHCSAGILRLFCFSPWSWRFWPSGEAYGMASLNNVFNYINKMHKLAKKKKTIVTHILFKLYHSNIHSALSMQLSAAFSRKSQIVHTLSIAGQKVCNNDTYINGHWLCSNKFSLQNQVAAWIQPTG